MAEVEFITLKTKVGVKLAYTFQAAAKPTSLLVVFINGLGLPQASWTPCINSLKQLRVEDSLPAILTYDRFGQGQTTDRDPQDAQAADPAHGHDALSSVSDLHQLITQVGEARLGHNAEDIQLLLVGNSIGGALARLYAQQYPGTVAGILFLDSVIANTDFVSIVPDPDSKDFDPETLPPGLTVDELRDAREGIRKIFHPDVGSREGLSRRNLATLLPLSDGPSLTGPSGKGPFVTVVEHDAHTFVEESLQMKRPKALTEHYVNPHWHQYNIGLTKLSDRDRVKGPIQAPHAGHFIQRDNPEFVAAEIAELLSRIIP